ncbi:DUF3526 domain-containing protein [Spirosoma arcticum]
MILSRIIRKEGQEIVRNRQLLLLALIVIVLLLTATVVGFVQYASQQTRIGHAQAERRAEWLGQGQKHPHMATHFGTFVFKPKTALSFFDYGVDAYTGTSVYLEAHYQHEFMFRPAQDHSGLIRFGELSGALVLQILLPLLIIFLCFGAFTHERERGTLRLVVSQGVSLQMLAWGKVGAYYGLLLMVLLPTLGLSFGAAVAYAGVPWTGDLGRRLGLMGLTYGVYVFGFVCFCVWVSAWSTSSRSALLTLLLVWITFTVILPKTTATLGDTLTTLPTTQTFQEAVSQDTKQGLPGDGTSAVRNTRLRQTYLTRYHADSVQHLPMNFEWVVSQAAEDYQDRVHARHRDRLVEQFETQNRVATWASLIDPYIAVRNLSMALSGTDLYTNLHFQQQASAYRAGLIRHLNADAARHSKYGEFYEYQTGPALWTSVPDFRYQPPRIGSVLSQYTIEGLALLLWGLLMPLLLHRSVNRLPL